MRRIVASEWITLDGVFDADLMDQWFQPYDSAERGDVIREAVNGSDAALIGRTTYEMLAPYWSAKTNNEEGIADKLNSMPKYVVSSSLKKADWNNSTIVRGNVVAEVKKLKQESGKRIVIFGSATLVQSLMGADLIDEYRFLVHPIIMGKGKRLFREGMDTTRLEAIESRALGLGVMLQRYGQVKD